MMKKIILSLSILALLPLLSACSNSGNTETDLPEEEPEPVELHLEMDVEEAYQDEVLTFSNEKNGYSLTYPATWSILDESNTSNTVYFISPERQQQMNSGDFYGKIGDFVITTFDSNLNLPGNSEGLSFEEFFSEPFAYTINSEKEAFTLGTATGYRKLGDPFDGSEIIMLEFDDGIIQISPGLWSEYGSEKELMLMSISF